MPDWSEFIAKAVFGALVVLATAVIVKVVRKMKTAILTRRTQTA